MLDSALRVFAEDGFRSGSLRDVAARASTSHATLLHHFGSKAGLLTALLERRLSTEGPARRRLVEELGFFDGMVAIMRRNMADRDLLRIEAVLQAEAIDPGHPAHAYFEERFAHFRTTALEDLRAARDAGLVREGVRLESATLQLLALINGLQVQWAYDPDGIDIAARVQDFLTTLRR